METIRYMISDAARMVDVEAHVLRYWEGELEIDIARNEMGHRYYTRENIDCFKRIHDMKENGYGLKAIKTLLQNQKMNIEMKDENQTDQSREESLRMMQKENEDEARYQRFDEMLRLRQNRKRRLCSQR